MVRQFSDNLAERPGKSFYVCRIIYLAARLLREESQITSSRNLLVMRITPDWREESW